MTLHGMDVDVEGDLNPAKYRGESDEPRAGFQTIRVAVRVDADADEAAVEAWRAEVAERCPVADNLRRPTTVDVSVDRA